MEDSEEKNKTNMISVYLVSRQMVRPFALKRKGLRKGIFFTMNLQKSELNKLNLGHLEPFK